MKERLEKYANEVSEIKTLCKVILERVENQKSNLAIHLEDDKKIAERVNLLEQFRAAINGKIIGFSTTGGFIVVLTVELLKSKGVL